MLLLTRKCISKTRVFLHPTFSLSQSFSSPATAPAASSITPNSDPTGVVSQHRDLENQQIIVPFKAWFQTAKYPLIDRIYEILTQRDDDDASSVESADLALSQLGFRLSVSFVVEVLSSGKDVLACLKFFDWAGRQPRFQHTRATFHAIFKVLSRAKFTNLMLDFLGAFKSRKYEFKSRYHETLVIGYAVAGKPEVALEHLGKMRFQGLDLDAYTYNVFLNILVERGFPELFDVILSQMKMRGHVNRFTDFIVIKSLCKQDQLGEAEEYLWELVSSGKVIEELSLGVLVDSLCKRYRFEDASRLIHEFRQLGCVSMKQAYDSWIEGLVRSGKPNIALGFIQELKSREGYIPHVSQYNRLIYRLLKEHRLYEVFDLLTEMKEAKVVPDIGTINAVMCFFCKTGMVDVAIEFFHLKSEFGLTPSALVYNYLVNSLCKLGDVDGAFKIMKIAVEEGKFHGTKTFWILADALCREGKFDKMMQLLTLSLEHKFKPNVHLFNRTISALCLASRVEEGYMLHSELNKLKGATNETTYCHMISEFSRIRRADIASRLLAEMQERGYMPRRPLVRAVVQSLYHMKNPEVIFFQLLEMQLKMVRDWDSCYTYNLFIDAAGHMRRSDLASKVYELMKDNGIHPDIDSDILMLLSYLKSDRLSDAFNFFYQLRGRTKSRTKPYHVMIVGLCNANRLDLAVEVKEEMKKNGMIPSLGCYEELVLSFCRESKYDSAVQLCNEMEKFGRILSTFIGNTFLFHSKKSRDFYQAWLRSRDFSIESPSNVMLSQLIASFSCDSWSNWKAEHLIEAIGQCFSPDVYTYNLLLRRLCKDHIDEALELFNKMCRKGYKPNKWTYDTLVYGLSKNGRGDEAKQLLEEMYLAGFYSTPATEFVT